MDCDHAPIKGIFTPSPRLPHSLLCATKCFVNSKGLDQAYRLQDFAFAAAMRLQAQLTNHEYPKQLTNVSKEDAQSIATLIKAWETAQERIRIHKGKPLPGSLSHEKVKQPRRASAKLSALSALADELSEPRPAAEQPSEPAPDAPSGNPLT